MYLGVLYSNLLLRNHIAWSDYMNMMITKHNEEKHALSQIIENSDQDAVKSAIDFLIDHAVKQ